MRRVSTRHAHRTPRTAAPLLRGTERDATVAPRSLSGGRRDVPLLEHTIGESLRRTVERFGDREALVVCDQGRAELAAV
jgi:hypothetical protein